LLEIEEAVVALAIEQSAWERVLASAGAAIMGLLLDQQHAARTPGGVWRNVSGTSLATPI
jgi:hypothetical protein